MPDLAELPCPRCGGSLEPERFYGPCAACRAQIAATVRAPEPDHVNYRTATRPMSAQTYVEYVGPRTERRS
jgi:hypothetical protein